MCRRDWSRARQPTAHVARAGAGEHRRAKAAFRCAAIADAQIAISHARSAISDAQISRAARLHRGLTAAWFNPRRRRQRTAGDWGSSLWLTHVLIRMAFTYRRRLQVYSLHLYLFVNFYLFLHLNVLVSKTFLLSIFIKNCTKN